MVVPANISTVCMLSYACKVKEGAISDSILRTTKVGARKSGFQRGFSLLITVTHVYSAIKYASNKIGMVDLVNTYDKVNWSPEKRIKKR